KNVFGSLLANSTSAFNFFALLVVGIGFLYRFYIKSVVRSKFTVFTGNNRFLNVDAHFINRNPIVLPYYFFISTYFLNRTNKHQGCKRYGYKFKKDNQPNAYPKEIQD